MSKFISPSKEWGSLFEKVQDKQLFPDSKTFADATPKYPVSDILKKYQEALKSSKFNLKSFILENFDIPTSPKTTFKTNKKSSVENHIKKLWEVLLKTNDEIPPEGSTLLHLPHSYIVPGGRFGEIYYWDSYFTMLGLAVHKKWTIIEGMIDNFVHLMKTVGHIPNGNRTYYATRSQPPFFFLMVTLLAEEKGDMIFQKYQKAIEFEYNFWMNSAEKLLESTAEKRVVRIEDFIVNRYWDTDDSPRPESFREDKHTAKKSKNTENQTYTHLRAAAESGWDFSSRWLKDGKTLKTIHTTDIIPVDLNSLLCAMEERLSLIYEEQRKIYLAEFFWEKRERRREFLNTYCWDEKKGFFFDYNFKTQEKTKTYSLAGVFPLFLTLADENQARKIHKKLKNNFLQDGGLTTTLQNTGQQWDAPNGWAPLQWVAFKGLKNYGFNPLANEIKKRWLALNEKIFKENGKLLEKYNVFNLNEKSGGGEYPTQDGFGWTNGVYLAMLKEK